jgi:replication factor C subunit 3/5
MAGMDIDQPSDLPWVEKYRPGCLDDLVAHEAIINTIQKFIKEKKLPHLLFYGPPGTGKTSTILAVAKEMYGKSFASMSLELNASDDRGINVVREQIKSFASTQQIMSRGVKLVILDEADSMTNAAQFALRRIIEKYTRTTRFCLICNYVSKIIPALQSRCTRFRFMPLSKEHARNRVRMVAENEAVPLTDDGMEALLTLGNGDMRKYLNILQSTAMAFTRLDQRAIYECTGNPDPEFIDQLIECLLTMNFVEGYERIAKEKVERGFSLTDIIREVHKSVMEIKFPEKMKIALIKQLSEIEYRLSQGASEKVQVGALVAAFISTRNLSLQ